MTLKKLLTLMLALCMSAACLTACGDSKDIDNITDKDVEDAINSIAAEEDKKSNSNTIESATSADDNTDSAAEEQPTVDNLTLMENATLQYPSQNDEWSYNVYDCYIELTQFIGEPTEELIIPNEIDGLPVWSVIAKNIDENGRPVANEITTSVIIPDEVLVLGSHAFSSYRALEKIKLPDGLVSIDYCAFSNCTSLKSIEIPEGVTEIGDTAFENCPSLQKIVLPASVQQIYQRSFMNADLELTVLNPECTFEFDGVSPKKGAIGTIYGYAGSTAATFAANNNIPFKVIEE